jgi:hypothetical protein
VTNVCADTLKTPFLQWLSAPNFDWWSQPEALRALERATGGPWWLVGGAAFVMFAAWTACYIVSFRRAKRDASYAFPIVNVALNFGWEVVFAFSAVGPLPRFYFPLQWGHLLWVAFDSRNIYQVFKYGRGMQGSPFTRRWFIPIALGTFALAAPAPYFFIRYSGDIMGVNSAMIFDVVMAAIFINIFANRPTLRGLSLRAGVFRFIGDVSSFVFLYLWWPAQFEGRLFATCNADAYQGVAEPNSYVFLYGMYVAATLLDALYLALVFARRRSLSSDVRQSSQVPATAAVHGNTPG